MTFSFLLLVTSSPVTPEQEIYRVMAFSLPEFAGLEESLISRWHLVMILF